MQYIETLLLLCCLSFCAHATTLPDTVKTGKEYLTLAQQQEAQENIEQAIEYYELAKGDFRRENDNSNLAYVLTKLAYFYISDSASRHKAEPYLDSAQSILQEPFPEGDTLNALLWSTKAELALAQEDYDKAIEYYQESLKIKEAFYGENHLKVASTRELIGDVYLYYLQNPYASETYYQKARDIRELVSGHDRLFYNTIYSLAYANRLRGDYDKALSYAFEVQRGYDSVPDATPYNFLTANSLLGTIYLDLDSIDKALYYNRNAIEIGRKIPEEDLSLHYNNQAEYFFQNQAYDSSLYYIKLAMDGQTDTELLATSYQFLGNVYREQRKLEPAFENYQRSKKLKEAIFGDYHAQLATLYIDIGQGFEVSQSMDSALYYYQLGLKSARISEQQSEISVTTIQLEDDLGPIEEALVKIADIRLKQYGQTNNSSHLKKALPYFKTFDRFMDLSRADFSTEGAKLILSGNNKSTYENAIASCYYLFQSNPSDSLLRLAFYFMEKSKAMVLLESIRETNQNQRLLPDSIIQQYQSLQARLAYYQSELIKLERKPDETDTFIEWQQKRADVLQELEKLDDEIQNSYPNYSAFAGNNFTISLDTLKNSLPNNKAIISYFWGDSTAYAMLVTRDYTRLHQIKNIDQLRVSVNQYRDVLVNDDINDPSYVNFLNFQESALNLYEYLLAPLQLDTTIQHLTIVTDGELSAIPFEGFITSTVETKPNNIRYEDLPYLIYRFGFSYELSSSVAILNSQRAKREEELSVVAFGIKDFEPLSGQRSYLPLVGAEEEVNYVREKFPQAQLFLNEMATEASFKQYASRADLLHIATHGVADRENPFDSRFIFYPTQGEDGTLYLHELYNMSLEAQLLILSACESGVGKYYVGEGSFSLARSFMYAGCHSVLMSLWEINDRLTTRMVTNIYDQLVEQMTTEEALQQTKLAFIKQGRLAHPQCWAGMVLLGNTPTKFTPSIFANYTTVVVSGTIALSILLILWLLRRYKRTEWLAKLGIQRQQV
ncbi:MAG: CHAT domain-containing tetratricopeptide repeat protein [Bacteroidota bacterium]